MDTGPKPKRVLVAAVHADGRNESSLGFVASMLRLQIELLKVATPIQVEVVFFGSFDAALTAAKQYDVACVLDTFVGFPPELITRALASGHDVVVGVVPLPGMDWERVAKIARAGDDAEPLSTAGVRYNVTPTAALGNGYWRFDVDAAKRAASKTVAVLTAAGLDAFAAHGIAAPGAAVDLDAPCSVLAQLGFEGCVGHRGRVLR
jgi:hypothetical protein